MLPALGSFVVEVQTPVAWVDITGSSTDLHVGRDEADVGTITVTVSDLLVDPTVADSLKFGQLVRFKAKDGSGWKVLYTGTAQPPAVSFDPKSRRTSISVTGQDNVSFLGNQPESRGVGTVDALRWLMTGVGVDFVINGSSSTLGAQTIVATNDGTSLWEQILVVRDSSLGFAWVNQLNQLVVCDADHLPTTPVDSVGPENYNTDVVIGSPDSIINSVTVNYQRYDIGSETTTEIPYGPYEDADSIAAKGRFSTTVTLQGVTEDPAAIEAYANELLARNAVIGDSETVKSVTVPINSEDDLKYAYFDLGGILTVVYPDGTTDGDFRIIGVEHTITPVPDRTGIKWMVTYTLDLPLALNVPVAPPGTGISVIPDGSVGTPQLQPGAVGLEQIDFSVRDLGGTTTFYGPTAPVGAVAGDLWFDTSDNNAPKRWDGSDWVDARDETIALAQATADGKNTVYYGPTEPTGDTYVDGDTWIDSANGNRLSRWDGTDWTLVTWDAEKVLEAGSIKTSQLAADAIDSMTINGVVISGSVFNVGDNITIDPTNGITINLDFTDDDGNAQTGLIQFPADGSPATITAKLRAFGIDSVDKFTLLGQNNNVVGSLQMASKWVAPKAKPTVALAYMESTNFLLPTSNGWTGLVEDTSTTWLTSKVPLRTSVGVPTTIWSINKATGVTTQVSLPADLPDHAALVAKIGSDYYVRYIYSDVSTFEDRIVKYDSSWNKVTEYAVGSGDIEAVGTDGTNLLLAETVSGVVHIRDPATGTSVGSYTVATNSDFANYGASAVAMGSFDYGADRLLIAANHTIYSYSISGSAATEQTAERSAALTAGGSYIQGLAWDSANIQLCAMRDNDSSSARIFLLGTNPASASRLVTVTYAHGTTPTYESKPSPAATITQTARSWLKITGPALPGSPGATDPDRLGIYIGNAKQGYTAAGVTTAIIGSPSSGGAAPTTEGFPTATPGQIVCQDTDGTGPLTVIKGNGDYRFAGTNLDDVAWTSMTSAASTARWTLRNGVMYVQIDGSVSTTSGTTATIVTAANGIPAALRPSVTVRDHGYFGGYPGTLIVGTDGSITGLQISGGSRTSVAGMVIYPTDAGGGAP